MVAIVPPPTFMLLARHTPTGQPLAEAPIPRRLTRAFDHLRAKRQNAIVLADVRGAYSSVKGEPIRTANVHIADRPLPLIFAHAFPIGVQLGVNSEVLTLVLLVALVLFIPFFALLQVELTLLQAEINDPITVLGGIAADGNFGEGDESLVVLVGVLMPLLIGVGARLK